MQKRLWLLLISLLLAPLAVAEELLEADKAFAFRASASDADTIQAEWDIADGYYLYRDKLNFRTETAGVVLGEPTYPPGIIKEDEFFGKMEIYRGKLSVTLPIIRKPEGAREISLTALSQGCAEQGVCYPPHRQSTPVLLPVQAAPATKGGILDFGFGAGGQDEVLEPDQAFVFGADALDAGTIRARWDIAPGHYLYRDKFAFALKDADGVTLGQAVIPQGEEKNDEFFGRIQVFHDKVEIDLPLRRETADTRQIMLEARYQGCAEIGICYPPITKAMGVVLPAGTAAASALSPPSPALPLSEQDSLALSLASGDTALTILTFFGLGLLLAFTPCVFPMVPILSSIIVGQGAGLTTRKAFTLSLVYVLAMAATYTVAGVIAGLFGANLQATFQNPWILGSFSALFVLLALSMFGFYELQLPSGLQSRLSELSNRQEGGTLAGVGFMGLLSALIVGPCVAPPLMGALIYIGQTGDPWLGGLALFALSMGMGAPLLAIGTSAGKLLPRAGGWMEAVKAVFGVLLLAVAIWMLERILPPTLTVGLWALLLIISAVYLGALERLHEGRSGWHRLWKGFGVVMLIYGALLLVAAASGGRDPLQPLGHLQWASAGADSAAVQPAHPLFKRVKTVDDLNRELAAAKARSTPVMLDFYADWCVSCKEFEKYTFSDPGVQRALAKAVLLQADVTANDAADQALLRHFGLFGPPSILFFDSAGMEQRNARIVGFLNPEDFRSHAERVLQ